MTTMQIRYRGKNFDVPKHYNVGLLGSCFKCPGSICLAPLSNEDKIASRLLALTETCWTYEERLGLRQELRDCGVKEKDLPVEVGRSSLMETCTRCHQVLKGRDAILTMVEHKKQLYCPKCARG